MPTWRASVEIDYAPAQGGPGFNVWHFRGDDPGTGTGGLQSALHDFYDGISGLYPSSTTIVGPTQVVDVDSSELFVIEDPWTVVGTGPNSFAPLATAITTTWYTTIATRSGRGRTFLGPVMVDAVDGDGQPTGDVLALIRAAAEQFVSDNGDLVGAAWGVYSVKDAVIRDIVRSAVHDRFASLRSRRD
jgi:hypothetical protein